MRARQLVEQCILEEAWNYFGTVFIRLCEDRNAPEFRALVLDNMGLAKSLAATMYTPAIPYDDMLSYATEALFRAAERFKPDSGAKFSTWAYKIIRNELINRRKEQAEYDANEPRILDAPADSSSDDSSTPTYLDREASDTDVQQDATKSISLDALRQAFTELSDEDRKLIQLAYIEGKTIRYIADLYDSNRTTTAHHITRALSHLRKLLHTKGFEVPDRGLKTTRG